MQSNVSWIGRMSIIMLRSGLPNESPRCDRKMQLSICLVLSREVRAVSTQTRGARVQLGGEENEKKKKEKEKRAIKNTFRSAYLPKGA